MFDTIPLFDEPPRPGVRPALTIARPAASPRWGKYTGQRVACDECVILLHESGGVGPLPRSARWVRRGPGVGEVLRFCHGHAALRRGA